MTNNIESEQAYFHERSIFHTSEPRNTKTSVHLILVFLCFAASFVAAIVFAETGGKGVSLTAQRSALQTGDYGKSE